MADFIITTLQSWDIGIGSTIKNTAIEISRQNRVFYINTPPGILQWIRTGGRPTKCNTTSVNDNLHIIYCHTPAFPAGSMPFRWLFNLMNYYNNYNIARTIKKVIKKYNIENYTHIIDMDVFRSRYLKQLLHPDISIYYRRDYIIGVDYWKKYGPACEYAIVSQADIVLTNSVFFTEELKSINSNIYTTNTGVDLELYNARINHERPADMADIPLPIIGYVGAIIQSRIDGELLYAVAQQLVEYNFVFVGPEDEYFRNHALHQLKNTFFLGRKDVHMLPQYIRHFDVCTNPQYVNPITEGNYPLKIDEYLAMGKPVVATGTRTMRDVFGQYTHLANDTGSWIKALRVAVNEGNDTALSQERIRFAHTHSWENSVKKIYQAIGEFKSKQGYE
ncbi:glycosyltransferase [Bacteroides zoogleoformans]|uniref:glycosyltransferase n=1 Tax=Bacteroides zoogleoformans TaxID=28119 RepID=UPI00248EBA4E|nr:glycosyltransferase [Bacteroides zoogleoformans]